MRRRRAAIGRVPRVIGLALALCGAFLTACHDDRTKTLAPGNAVAADSADQVIFGSRTLITDRGMLRAEIQSDTAFFFDDNTRVEMLRVRGIFFSSSGAKDAVLTSRTGLYNTRNGMLEARGDVVMISVDGRKLTTPLLRYDQRVNQVSSDSAFVLTEPGREVSGIGFLSDPDMNNIRILRASRAKAGSFTLPGQ